jgi:2-C-methyl-D-erythritol 4-phosphate cytidylyltransferase
MILMEVWAIVLAAGAARRFGAPKQFEFLGELRLVDRVVKTAVSICDEVIVALPPRMVWNGPPLTGAVVGGRTRAESVRRGLNEVPSAADIIVIADAAHPLTTRSLFRSVIDAVRRGADGAVPALPVTEVIKRVRSRRIVETLPSAGLVSTQTPQAFRADVLRRAHAGRENVSEDSVLLESMGAKIAVVPGDPRNIHVTTRAELEIASILAHHS